MDAPDRPADPRLPGHRLRRLDRRHDDRRARCPRSCSAPPPACSPTASTGARCSSPSPPGRPSSPRRCSACPAPPCWLGYLVMAGQASLAALFEPARNALVRDLVGPDGVDRGQRPARHRHQRLPPRRRLARRPAVRERRHARSSTSATPSSCSSRSARSSRPFGVRHEPAATRAPAVREWLDGLAMIRRDRGLWVDRRGRCCWARSSQGHVPRPVRAVRPRRARRGGPGGVGLLRGVQAVGGLVAGAGVAVLARRVAPRRLFGWGAVAFGVLSAVVWNGPYVTDDPRCLHRTVRRRRRPQGVAVSGLISRSCRPRCRPPRPAG